MPEVDPAAARPSLGPVLLTVMLDLLGFGLVIPLMSFYAEGFRASPVQVTMLMATYSLAQFLFAPFWGAVSDRYGRRPVMLMSIGGAALFLAGFASATTLGALYVFRALHGACAANIGTAQAIVADITTREDRARGMGLIGAAFGFGFTLGPVLGGLLSHWGLAAPIWFAAALSVINFVWVARSLPETRTSNASTSPRRTVDPGRILRTLAHPVVGGVVSLTFGATFAFAMFESTFGLVAEHVWSMGARTVGLLFGLIGIIAIVVQGGLVGRLVRRFGEGRLVAGGYACTATGMALLAATAPAALWLADGWLTIVGGCALMALGTSLSNPALNALISKGTPEDEQGSVLGVNQSLAALARATAPAAGGAIYASWYAGGAFAAGALLMVGALLLAIPALRRATTRRADAAAGPGRSS